MSVARAALFSLPGQAIECPSFSLPARRAASVVYLTNTKSHRTDAHRLGPSAVFEELAWIEGHRFSRWRPGLAIGIPLVLSLPTGKAASRGAGRGQCPWPRFDLLTSCSQVYLRRGYWHSGTTRMCHFSGLCSLLRSPWFWVSVFSWRCARPLSFASSFFFPFSCSWWSVLMLPLSWGPQCSGRASDELRTASSSRTCGSFFIRRLERCMLLWMDMKNVHSE